MDILKGPKSRTRNIFGPVVMGRDSFSWRCGFQSQHLVLDGHFILKFVLFVWKRPQRNEKEPIFKKHCWEQCNLLQKSFLIRAEHSVHAAQKLAFTHSQNELLNFGMLSKSLQTYPSPKTLWMCKLRISKCGLILTVNFDIKWKNSEILGPIS